MKKLSVLLLIALSSALLMTGCGKEEEPEVIEEAVVVETVDEPETEEIVEEEVNEDLPPEEGMVRSRLTNEWVSEEVGALRPLAVMVPNDKSALPQYNLSNADLAGHHSRKYCRDRFRRRQHHRQWFFPC